jgi:hypothetical protein
MITKITNMWISMWYWCINWQYIWDLCKTWGLLIHFTHCCAQNISVACLCYLCLKKGHFITWWQQCQFTMKIIPSSAVNPKLEVRSYTNDLGIPDSTDTWKPSFGWLVEQKIHVSSSPGAYKALRNIVAYSHLQNLCCRWYQNQWGWLKIL